MLSLLFSALAAGCFSLVFYSFNTPLGASLGSDNAIYLTMGTALARGYSPYTEIFDHKGPLLFLIQWLPQALSGGYSTLAVFLQEALVLFCCLRVLTAIAGRLRAPEGPVQLVYLALLCAITGGGNLTEEYTALPTLLGLLLILRVFDAPLEELPADGRALLRSAFLLGLCCAGCFLVRANNALPLCAFTAGLSLCLLLSRRFAALGRCAAGFLAGFAAALLPVVCWLALHGALGAAFYGAIVHNLLYAETGDTGRVYMLLHSAYGHLALGTLALACAGALTRLRRAPAFAFSMLLSALAGLYAAFISHKFYQHYLMIAVPAAALGAALLLGCLFRPRLRRGVSLALCLLCLGVLAVQGKTTNDGRLAARADLPAFTADAQRLYGEVPEAERGRFMAYRVEPRWYAVTGALPCMRFYFLQETLAQANPAVMDEIVETFQTDPPLWLVIYYNRAFSPPYDPRVAEIFRTRYAFVEAAGEYQLLRLVTP